MPKARESLPAELKTSRLPSSGGRKGSSSAKRSLSKTGCGSEGMTWRVMS